MIDVLICGAGPSGLHLAAQLLKRGLTVRLIDKSLTPSDKSKAIIVHARTLELLEELELAGQFIENGVIYDYLEMRTEKGLISQIHLDKIPSKYNFIMAIEQSQTEALFIEYLKNNHLEVDRDIELISFVQNSEKVKYTTRNNTTGQIEELETRWLIGCDGAHSIVRKGLKLEFSGVAFHEIISLADLEVDWKYPEKVGVGFLTQKGIFLALPIKGDHRYRLLFTLDRLNAIKNIQDIAQGIVDTSIASPPTIEEIQHLIRSVADPNATLKNPNWLSNFKLSSRVVDSFQEGRVFLAGDSAHIHTPLGGQGMNTGIQDGYNLAWKLAMVQKNQAYDSLLQSYTIERHENALKLLSATEKGTRAILLKENWKTLLTKIVSFVSSIQAVKNKLVLAVSQLAVKYSKNPWVVQKFSFHIKTPAGHRAPDAVMISSNDGKKRLFDFFKENLNYRLLLIDLEGHVDDYDSVKNIFKEEYHDLVKPVVITSKEDSEGDFAGFYGNQTVYLIRPDGYVGYCGPLKKMDELYRYLDHILK